MTVHDLMLVVHKKSCLELFCHLRIHKGLREQLCRDFPLKVCTSLYRQECKNQYYSLHISSSHEWCWVEVRLYDCRTVAERLWLESNVRTRPCKISIGCCQNILEDIMGPCASVEISYLLCTPLKNNIALYLHLSEDIIMWNQWLGVEHLLRKNRCIIWLIFLVFQRDIVAIQSVSLIFFVKFWLWFSLINNLLNELLWNLEITDALN